MTLLDPLSLAIVVGGALGSAAIRSTRVDMRSAIRALGAAVRADPAADADRVRLGIARIERVLETRARGSADRLEQEVPFVRAAARALAEAEDAADFHRWSGEEAAGLLRRHARAHGFWRAVADAAPAMGMIGTVIALCRMFATLDGAGAIGPAMAMAMLTTLYGLVLSAGIAGPIAARLERLSAAEAEWRDWVCRRLGRIAETEFAGPRARTKLRLVE